MGDLFAPRSRVSGASHCNSVAQIARLLPPLGRFFALFRESYFIKSGRQREANPVATRKKFCEPIILCSVKIDPFGAERCPVWGVFTFYPTGGDFRASAERPNCKGWFPRNFLRNMVPLGTSAAEGGRKKIIPFLHSKKAAEKLCGMPRKGVHVYPATLGFPRNRGTPLLQRLPPKCKGGGKATTNTT